MKVRATIFDADGPIIDSFDKGLERIEVLANMHNVHFDNSTKMRLVNLWGLYGPTLLEQGLQISREEAAIIYPKWEAWDRTSPQPLIEGAREALRTIGNQGVIRTLLTSRNRQNVNDIFDKLDLHRELDITQTYQESSYKKPDPRVFDYTLELLEKQGISRSECIFIGDTDQDIQAGINAGIETLVVLTGPYGYKIDELLTLQVKPQNILTSIARLPEWLYTYNH